MRKKLFTFFLALAASIVPLFAESGTCGSNLTWDLSNGVLTITGTGAMTNYSSSSSVPWYSSRESIKTVIIGDGVTSIGDRAFYNCNSLTSVAIPNSVTSIGNRAFSDCSALTSVTIPNSVTSIGYQAFESCRGLTSITIPNSVTSIGWGAFRSCTNLTSVTIPNSVESIGSYTFEYCSGLTSITIPNSVTIIGDGAFADCSGLTSIEIPNSITSIGGGAFSGCSVLTSVTIPNSVTSIGNNAFYECSGLTSPIYNVHIFAFLPKSYSGAYTIPDGIESIAGTAFSGCSSLTSITIPNSVTIIGDGAFADCSGLTSVTIPNSVTSIGDIAFYECSSLPVVDNIRYADTYLVEAVDKSLSTYNIKQRTKWIGNSAFYGCTALTSIEIPNSVTSIKSGAFADCTSLTSVMIGNSVTNIEDYAFGDYAYYGTNIKIYISALIPPQLGEYSFGMAESKITAYVPPVSFNTYKNTKGWNKLNIQNYVAVSPTGCIISYEPDETIVSIGISGGEQQPGNVLEYIGLEPNSEYKDVPVVLTANTGDTETINISFSTTALTLTTKPSKLVSATTAILLAETNMSDAEVSCGFEYKRNDAPADMSGTKVFCPVASGQMAGRLKGLKDDVYYKYRAFYQSTAGNMYYGDWQYIFTGDVAVEFDPILYTYGATVVRENEATISGYALAGSEDFTEQGFEYWAESRANGGANAPRRMTTTIGEHKFVQANGIKMSVTLTDLDEGTVYKYRAYGKTGNQFFYGSEQTFTTSGEWQEEQGIEEILSDKMPTTKVHKILHNGQIYILHGEKVYTLTGQEVK